MNLKQFALLMVICIFIVVCVMFLAFVMSDIALGGYGYNIYHTILLESHYNNRYILYSGIQYNDLFNPSIIEFQIYPIFEGTKEECKIMKKNNQAILKEKLKYYRDKRR